MASELDAACGDLAARCALRRKEDEGSPMADLPLALLLSVFALMDGASCGRAACVCRSWSSAARSEWLWRTLCDTRWGACTFTLSLTPSWRAAYAERHSLPKTVNALVQEARWPLRSQRAFAALAGLQRAHLWHVLDLLDARLDAFQGCTRHVGLEAKPCLYALGVDTFAGLAASPQGSGEAALSVEARARLLLDAALALDRLVHGTTTSPSANLRRHVLGLGAAFCRCLAAQGLDSPATAPLDRLRALNRFLFAEPAEGLPRGGFALTVGDRLDLGCMFGEEVLAEATAGRGGLGLGTPPAQVYYAPCNSTLLNLFRTRQALPILLIILEVAVGACAGVAVAVANVPRSLMTRTPPGLCMPPIFFDPTDGGRELSADQVAESLDLHDGPEADWRTQLSCPRAIAQRLLGNVVWRPDGKLAPSVPLLGAYIPFVSPVASLQLRLARVQLALADAQSNNYTYFYTLKEDVAFMRAFADPQLNLAPLVEHIYATLDLEAVEAKLLADEERGEAPLVVVELFSLQGRWAHGEYA